MRQEGVSELTRLPSAGIRTIAPLLCALGVGCSAAPSDDSETAASTEADRAWLRCTAVPYGAAKTTVGALSYHDEQVWLTTQHDAAAGCVVGAELRLERADGCRLELTLSAVDGAWRPTAGQLTVDDGCGAEWSARHGVHPLYVTASSAGLDGVPVASPSEGRTCLTVEGARVLGRLVFEGEGEDTPIEVLLPGVSYDGGIRSTALEASAGCPAAPIPCDGVVCGVDPWGIRCDSCEGDTHCEGESCVAAGCPPPGPAGVDVGMAIEDIELPDCEGNMVNLQSVCGAKAGYVGWFADWCPTCAKFIAQMNGVYAQHSHAGLRGIAVLMADSFKNPPTAHDCKNWREEKGLEMLVLYDPTGVTLHYGGKETSVLTDSTGVIVFRETGTNPHHLEKTLTEELAKSP